MEWMGKRVSVVGLGKSNLALIRYLVRHGALVTAHDQKSEAELGSAYDELCALGVEMRLGPGYLEGLEAAEGIFRHAGHAQGPG